MVKIPNLKKNFPIRDSVSFVELVSDLVYDLSKEPSLDPITDVGEGCFFPEYRPNRAASKYLLNVAGGRWKR